MSPNSNRELMSATFTPKGGNLKAYSIPNPIGQGSEMRGAALSWHGNNYPSPGHKPTFNIGCANAPKVNIVTSTNESNTNHTSVLQGIRVEDTVDTTQDSSDEIRIVTGNPRFSSISSLQRMDQNEEPMEDLDESMISPNARIARKVRRAAQAGNGTQGHPGTPVARQSPQATPGDRQGPLHHEEGVQGPLHPVGGVQEPDVNEVLTDEELSAKEAEAINANKALRIAIDAMILLKNIQVEACYPQILDEVVLKKHTQPEMMLKQLRTKQLKMLKMLPGLHRPLMQSRRYWKRK